MRAEFLDGGEDNPEHERIETSPRRIVDPGLETTERNAGVVEILMSEKRTQRDSAENNSAGNNRRRAGPAIHKKQDERQRQIKLVFDGERPRVREGGAAMKRDVLNRKQKFPERLCHVRILAPRR